MDKSLASHVVRWVSSDAQAGGLLLTAQRLLALESIIKEQLPASLRHSFAAAQLQGTDLVIVVDHSAMAAKIRQLQPSLIKQLNEAGWGVQSIRAKVASQPRAPERFLASKTARPLDTPDLQHFEDLKGNLRPGPLAEAVQKLLRHHRLKDDGSDSV